MNTMNIPGFCAERALSRPMFSFVGTSISNDLGSSVITANGGPFCANVNCDAAWATCVLLFNPVSCDMVKECCVDGYVEPDCRNNPCGPGCPNDLCITSGQYGLNNPVRVNPPPSMGSRDVLSDIQRRLSQIERCTCGVNPLVYSSVLGTPTSVSDYDWPRGLPRR